jgi:hypothetical protein
VSPLLIQTTGLEEYAPGGKARIKVLTIGGPGAGKTRWSSYFPQPIYADCERGLASVADRKVPYVNIKNSQDMLDLLSMLKQECAQPAEQRRFHTVVIDTLDAFQRKIKNEWMEKEKKQTFTGWEAWGYLNARMQLLMTRLLNLDMHVIVNVHYKDRTTKDDETGKETHELMLQLQGELADTAFNDFDLVGWMGTYWESVDGQRVQKRGLTFKPTPDKPFLKDRLHVTPSWLEVTFADSDFENLFARIQEKITEIGASEILGEVPSEEPAKPSGFVFPPGAAGSGAMPVSAPRDVPLQQMDKPTLLKMCRDRGITTTTDGGPIKGNTLKAELIDALEAAGAQEKPDAPTAAAPAPAAEPAGKSAASQSAQPAPTPVGAPAQALNRVANARRTRATGPTGALLKQEPEGLVNTKTGELVNDRQAPPTIEQAVVTVAETLGGQVIDEQPAPEPTIPDSPPSGPTGAAAPVAEEGPVCEVCGTKLADEPNQDAVKLAWIKYRKRLCAKDYQAKKR